MLKIPNHFSIVLRTFSTKNLFAFLLFAIIVFSAACSQNVIYSSDRTVEGKSFSSQEEENRRIFPVAPWTAWGERDLGSSKMSDADRLAKLGEFENSIALYGEVIAEEFDERIKTEAFVRQIGTILKTGQRKRLLETVSAYLKTRGLSPTEADSRISFIVAYSYQLDRNYNQILAWLRQAYLKESPSSDLPVTKIQHAIAETVGRIPEVTFNLAAQKWARDEVLGPVFTRETLRRSSGGVINSELPLYYFKGDSYVNGVVLGTDPQNLPQTNNTGSFTIAALLPLSGQFAPHAELVRKGIELAVEQSGLNLADRFLLGDTQALPEIAASEYRRLVTEKGASVVLGPLLVKTAESVAAQSSSTNVPFITFTKRPGITTLGNNVFRLGVTSESQINEILEYGLRNLTLKTYAVFYPDNELGRELSSIFRAEVGKRGGSLVAESSYSHGNEALLKQILERLAVSPPDGIFIPDTLEGCFNLVQMIKARKEFSRDGVLVTEELFKHSVLIGTALWGDVTSQRGFGQIFEGSFFVTPFNPNSKIERVAKFVRDFSDKFGVAPDMLSAQSFDAANLSIKAASETSKPLTEALRGVRDFAGVTGTLSVLPNGEILRRMSVQRFINGEAVEVMNGGVSVNTSSPDIPFN